MALTPKEIEELAVAAAIRAANLIQLAAYHLQCTVRERLLTDAIKDGYVCSAFHAITNHRPAIADGFIDWSASI